MALFKMNKSEVENTDKPINKIYIEKIVVT